MEFALTPLRLHSFFTVVWFRLAILDSVSPDLTVTYLGDDEEPELDDEAVLRLGFA